MERCGWGIFLLFLHLLTLFQEDINPTQKPRRLWAHLLGTLLPNPDLIQEGVEPKYPVVLDLTSGSGSLTLACAEAGISSIAFERDPKQADASAANLKKFFGNIGFEGANTVSRGANTVLEEEEDEGNFMVIRNLRSAFETAAAASAEDMSE